MKSFKVFAIAMALVLGLAASIFAVGNLAVKSVAAKQSMSCCADAACCAGGDCKMNGACCGDHGSASKAHEAHAVKASGVAIENASDAKSAACHHDKAQQTASEKKADCCDGNSACCHTGAACCSTKKQTARL